MKILKKALLSLSIILLNATSVYATTTGTYVPESNSGTGKFFLFLIAIGLVALVLFIGYKMDKNEAQEKRKEKIIKQRDNDINDMYSKIYSSYEDNKKEILEEEIVEDIPEVNFKPETEEYFKDVNKEETQKINLIDEEIIDEYIPIEENVDTEIEKETINENYSYTEKNDNDEKEEYENKDFGETQVIAFEEEGKDEEEFDSTMVFDVGPLKDIDVNMNVEEKIINKISDVKGYDYEDNDLDLLDLEQTIAEANIKKYTRDKNQEMIKVKRTTTKKSTKKETKETKKESKDAKKYTRKKSGKTEKELEKKDDEKEEKKTTKKYKAKKVASQTEENIDEKEVISKAKKYTKVNSKKEKSEEVKNKKERKTSEKETVVEKPKRGRKPKVKEETVEKPKRGRKPSTKK